MKQDWGTYRNKRGLEFFITAEQQGVPDGAKYRLWYVSARLDPEPDTKAQWFRIFVTTEMYPEENLAQMLARGTALDCIKGLLEHTDEVGRPLVVTQLLHEGWAVI